MTNKYFVSAAMKSIWIATIPKKNTKMFEYNYNELQWMTNKPIEEFSDITKKIIDNLEKDDYFQGIIKLNQIISKQNPNLN
jgi:frataxin-like iron-binding protein CyaY